MGAAGRNLGATQGHQDQAPAKSGITTAPARRRQIYRLLQRATHRRADLAQCALLPKNGSAASNKTLSPNRRVSWKSTRTSTRPRWSATHRCRPATSTNAMATKRSSTGVDVTVSPTSRVVVVGPNGAGKSTLLRLLAGVEAAGRRAASPSPRAWSSAISTRNSKRSTRTRRSLTTFQAGRPGDYEEFKAELLSYGLFVYPDLAKTVRTLSVGQKRKLQFAQSARPARQFAAAGRTDQPHQSRCTGRIRDCAWPTSAGRSSRSHMTGALSNGSPKKSGNCATEVCAAIWVDGRNSPPPIA